MISCWSCRRARLLSFYLALTLIASAEGDRGRHAVIEEALGRHIDYYKSTDDIRAFRLEGEVSIDGHLAEASWDRTGWTGFTQQDPEEGERSSEQSILWVGFDDEALYVAARLFDRAPDSIAAEIGRRDEDLQSDWFAIGIDSYHDHQTGFYFLLTPAASIEDGTFSNDSWSDNTWDGVWESAAQMDSLGWTAELRIPYSQLRFSRKDVYTWGFNAARFIQRKNELSYLKLKPRDSNQEVSIYPHLVGIEGIEPARRLEVIPYVVTSGRFLNFPDDDPFGRDLQWHNNVGADLKFGLGSNFTVDATLNPDFGQVELDPAVVNLSAFETFFSEKRPFFIEGQSIFQFGNRGATSHWGFNSATPSFFYSRRIGRPPQGSVERDGEADIPQNSTIIGAGKLSGKTGGGWEVGMVQAATAREYAEIDSSGRRFTEEVEPLTSYTVLRAFKNFGDNRYGLGLLGTSVLRDLRTTNLRSTLRRNAFTGGIDGFAFLGEERTWALSGWLGGSHLRGSTDAMTRLQRAPQHYYQRPDFEYTSLDSSRTSLSGMAGRVSLNKEKGNTFLNTAFAINTPGFDSNDLGFNSRNNLINHHLVLGYRWYDPTPYFRSASWFASSFRNFDLDGNHIAEGMMSFFNVEFLNYYSAGMDFGYFPATTDIQRTRGGPAMESPASWFVFGAFETDGRKPLIFEAWTNYGANTPGGWDFTVDTELEWRPSSRMSFEINPSYFRDHAIAQWITRVDDPAAVATFGSRYVFGVLDQRQLSASLRMNYTFNPRLTFQLFLQPLLAAGTYSDIKELARPNSFDFLHYGEGSSSIQAIDAETYEIDPDGGGTNVFTIDNPDFNFKSIRGTAVLRWEFAPGSTLFLVWTHDRDDFENAGRFRFGRDLDRLLDAEADNIVLMKLSYWWNP